VTRVHRSVFDLNVHPAAEVFPMLSDDELDELAADVKANGLLHPIVVKGDLLVDGRNRREACRRAGVEPQVEELNGTDPVAYILATNVNRRHLTKGQRAMAVAKLYPEGEKTSPGKKSKTAEMLLENKSISGTAISQARTVLRWLPELADLVMAGSKPLNEAYAEAHRLKEQADGEAPRLARLRERAPDLADQVAEGRMPLIEAEAAYTARLSEARRARQAVLDVLEGLTRYLDFFAAGPPRDHVVATLAELPDDTTRLHRLIDQWVDNLTGTKEALISWRLRQSQR
jgi:ParB/Sulfiredoxin domain